jgi:hypothetical protein
MKYFCNLKPNCFTINQIQYYTCICFQKSPLPLVTSVELGKQGPVDAASVVEVSVVEAALVWWHVVATIGRDRGVRRW